MTTYNKTQLKTFFEQGDVPSGTDYANLIDSQLNLVETVNQTMAGPLTATKLVAPTVSATNFNVTGGFFANIVSANTLAVSDITVNSSYTQNDGSFSVIGIEGNINLSPDVGNVNLAPVTGGVSLAPVTGNVNIAGTNTIFAGNLIFQGGPYKIQDVVIVSAAGTAQASAPSIGTNLVVRLQGATDGQATGYKLANTQGIKQYIYNENAVSANLYPDIGCKINGLGTNAAFGLAATTMYTVLQYAASAYAVK